MSKLTKSGTIEGNAVCHKLLAHTVDNDWQVMDSLGKRELYRRIVLLSQLLMWGSENS